MVLPFHVGCGENATILPTRNQDVCGDDEVILLMQMRIPWLRK